jgi:hypothetical protein
VKRRSLQLEQEDLNLAQQMCHGPADILTNLLSRYFSITQAADTVHPDRGHLRDTIMEIARLRQAFKTTEQLSNNRQEQIADLRAELAKAKAFAKV